MHGGNTSENGRTKRHEKGEHGNASDWSAATNEKRRLAQTSRARRLFITPSSSNSDHFTALARNTHRNTTNPAHASLIGRVCTFSREANQMAGKLGLSLGLLLLGLLTPLPSRAQSTAGSTLSASVTPSTAVADDLCYDPVTGAAIKCVTDFVNAAFGEQMTATGQCGAVSREQVRFKSTTS